MESDAKMLISVHVPKCAGSSFCQWLQATYSEENVYLDYCDGLTEPVSIVNIDPCGFLEKYRDGYPELEHKRVVHGHFWVKKYQYLKNAIRITFLREPVERAISQYFYWLKFPHTGSVHSYFLDYKLSIEQFCRLPLIQNIYTELFFRDVDMAVFDFIGGYSALGQELLRLGKILQVNVALPEVNTNPSESYNIKVQEIRENKTLLSKLQKLLAEDIRFYEKYAGR
ncbi:sulfotransferase [Lucifera butyrica]|uniref:Sulfotransferase n=1 Tax=Lucifera butyrica TaxID=1351585 RepID=A0A498RG56_9FIRM|nr:sulfotransferase family 2 domain-containing protein [Lucifera butyrica]VBB09062.1 sulfotransferase [Lucifera butyrica]